MDKRDFKANKKGIGLVLYIAFMYLLPYIITYTARIIGLEQRFKFNHSGSFLFFAIIIAFFFVRFKDKLKENMHDRARFWYASLGIGFFVIYFMMMYVFWMNVSFAAYIIIAYMLYGLGAAMLFISVVGVNFVKKHRKTMMLIVILVMIFFQAGLYMRENWQYFSSTVVKGSYLTLNAIGEGDYVLEGMDPALTFEGFSVRIGAPCSGIDSLSMFCVIFFLIVVLDWERFNPKKRKKLWWVFIAGMTGMFIVSILRVVVLMIIGARFSKELALGMFHTNAGWILFVAYVLLFWNLVYGWLRR